MRLLRVAVTLFTWLSAAALTISSQPSWWNRQRLLGWNLWAHSAVAVVFLLSMVLFVLFGAQQLRQLPFSVGLWRRSAESCYWGMGFTALGTLASALLAMAESTSQAAQAQLWQAHHVLSLILVVFIVLFSVTLCCSRRVAAARV